MWNYPSNPSSGYMADTADWSDDNSFGMDKRVNELLTGTYRAWPNLDPVSNLSMNVDTFNEVIAKYVNYFDQYGDDTNLTFNMLHKYPIVEATMRAKNGQTVLNIFDRHADALALEVENVVGYTTGDQVTVTGLTNVPTKYSGLLDDGDTFYAVVYGTNILEAYSDSALTTLTESNLVSGNEVLQNGQSFDIASANEKYHVFFRNGDNELCMLDDKFGYLEEIGNPSGNTTIRTLRLGESLSVSQSASGSNFESYTKNRLFNARAAGTVNGDRFSYITPYVGSDESQVTIVTVESYSSEDYLTTDFTKTYTTAALDPQLSITINNETVSNTLALQLKTAGNFLFSTTKTGDGTHGTRYYGIGRVSYTVNSGSRTQITNDVGTSINYNFITGWELKSISGTNTLTVWVEGVFSSGVGAQPSGFSPFRNRGSTGTALTTLNSNSSLTVTHKFIDHQHATHLYHVSTGFPGDTKHAFPFTKVASAGTTSVGLTRYEIDTVAIKHPGNRVYSYKDTNNATQYGASFDLTKYWIPGATSASSVGIDVAPDLTLSLNGSGYLNSITLGTDAGDRGQFTTADAKVFEINPTADAYVAPTPYAPDVFDTDDEWDSDAYSDGAKVWPSHVAPMGVKITTNQPSSVTAAYNATKYVRSSGVVRSQMEVTYPPMSYDDFREFEAVAEAARGQATPFYFNVRGLETTDKEILLQRTDGARNGGLTAPFDVRVKTAAAVGDTTMLLEGFAQNISNVFIRGESVIMQSRNGNINVIGNDNVDSNKYGEAKIRLTYPLTVAQGTGNQLYKNPFHIVVTLADDEFEYNVGTDGLYRFTCRFDFDEFK